MRFIISIDDEKYQSFLQRAEAAFGEDPGCVRICITPETLETEPPAWFQAHKSRWCLCQAILTALKTARDAGDDCEIFEEDCIFAEGFAEKRERFLAGLPEDWDMAYLGGQCLALQFYPLKTVKDHPEVLLCKNAHRNHAWICRHASIQRLIDWLETGPWPCRHTTDWRIGYLQMKEDFHVYIPRSGWLCGQGAGYSSLDRREYPDRWWQFTVPEDIKET